MKSSSFTLILPLLALIQFSQGQLVYKDRNAPLEQRVSDLLGRMTTEEKIQQLNQLPFGVNLNPNNKGETVDDVAPEIGSLIYLNEDPVERNAIQRRAMEKSRLGIPILFGFDTIHGIRTVYPIPLAQACGWNPSLVSQAAAIAARETNLTGIDWTFSPMTDVARDPRWGRVAEGYGEDPYAASVFCAATVRGYQGADLSAPYSIAACLKHFVGYSMSEGGRDYHSTDISAQALWETYLPPFEAGVKAGAATLMSGFNDISGVPASANHYTLTEILKQRWKHDGFVVSDWNSIEQLIAQGVAKDRKEAGLKSFLAGVEMDMADRIYLDHLGELVSEGKVSMELINESVARVLRVKFRLGLFEQPYTKILAESERYLKPEDKAVAAKLAGESMVLLKNDGGVLPLSSKVKTLALIGPLVKDQENLLGCWSGNGKAKDVETIFEGMNHEFGGKVKLSYAKGCDFDGTDESGFDEAFNAARKADAVALCIGEKKAWSGENASRSSISLPAIQEKLVARLKQTGKPIILVLSNGRPLELQRLEPLADAIVEMWQPGVAGGTPLAGILSGRVNPSGRLAITFPLVTGQIPIYYGMRSSARPNDGNYKDVSTEPLYPFGHGLSYTYFQYGKATLSKDKVASDQILTVRVPVTNTGSVAGQETVFWFISDPVCSVSRPMKELKHFEKKTINPGETVVFTFEIDPMRDLSHPDSTGKRLLEAGDFHVRIKDQKLTFELVDNDDSPTVSTPVPPVIQAQ
jgi:beta-glucosidase